MKKPYIKPEIYVVTIDNEFDLMAIYATAPDMPWDNEDGEVWGENAKAEKTYQEKSIWDEQW